MTNDAIAEQFSLLAKLMDIHGENSFKSKSYANAAFQIEKLQENIAELPPAQWQHLKGIGANIATRISEILLHGTLPALAKLIQSTPEGVLQMLEIKGIGAKKINTIWKEMEIESLGELLYACNENRLLLYKGFGAKTQQNVKEAIEFYFSQTGKVLFSEAEKLSLEIEAYLKKILPPDTPVMATGALRRTDDTIEEMEWIVLCPADVIKIALEKNDQNNFDQQSTDTYKLTLKGYPPVLLHSTAHDNAGTRMLTTTGPTTFVQYLLKHTNNISLPDASEEKLLFEKAGLPFVAPQHRQFASANPDGYHKLLNQNTVTTQSIKGIIHSHSTWSDGAATPEQMAVAAIEKGFEYLVLSDHSKAAAYAGGLTVDKIVEQHQEIDKLNKRLQPFRIFKSIECDILSDGSLDYDEETLATFDLVIASVHSGLKMTEEKAMARLLTAIENPYTLILGHLTGRLLLSRKGYPVDHKKIIDACAANLVAIELNAHPRRLDMDWTWIPYALDKGVLISINPDAHYLEGFEDVQYGVTAAAKALLPQHSNLSSFSLPEFENWIIETRKAKGTL
jgi:DNA polymerase (family 10)